MGEGVYICYCVFSSLEMRLLIQSFVCFKEEISKKFTEDWSVNTLLLVCLLDTCTGSIMQLLVRVEPVK